MALNDKYVVETHTCIKVLRTEDNLHLFKCLTIMLDPCNLYSYLLHQPSHDLFFESVM